MPMRTYDPPSSHIMTLVSPSRRGPSITRTSRASDAGRRPPRPPPGRGGPARTPGAAGPGRRRSPSPGTARRPVPGASAPGPGTRPRGAPPAPWCPPVVSVGTRCRSVQGLCRALLGHRVPDRNLRSAHSGLLGYRVCGHSALDRHLRGAGGTLGGGHRGAALGRLPDHLARLVLDPLALGPLLARVARLLLG